jgi:hypothetical protein
MFQEIIDVVRRASRLVNEFGLGRSLEARTKEESTEFVCRTNKVLFI